MKNKSDLSAEGVLNLFVDDEISLRLYEDTRPWNYEIGGVQKGLVLVHNGVEIIGEGAGFGVPIAKYRDKTFFPGSGCIQRIDANKVVKTFTLNTISTKKIGERHLPDTIYHKVHRLFTKLYLDFNEVRPLFDAIIKLRRSAGVTTEFIQTHPRGRVRTVYELKEDIISVEMNFNCLASGLEQLIVLNEQGADWFYCYRDSEGKTLSGRQIGAWDEVTADEASIISDEAGICFHVKRKNGSQLMRGWEKVEGSLSWAGLNYILPDVNRFDYDIRLGSI